MGCLDRSKVSTPKSFPGSKSLSSERFGSGKGKMSSAHGCTSGNPAKGMEHASGRLGAGRARFSSGIPKQGPCNIGSGSKSYKGHGK